MVGNVSEMKLDLYVNYINFCKILVWEYSIPQVYYPGHVSQHSYSLCCWFGAQLMIWRTALSIHMFGVPSATARPSLDAGKRFGSITRMTSWPKNIQVHKINQNCMFDCLYVNVQLVPLRIFVVEEHRSLSLDRWMEGKMAECPGKLWKMKIYFPVLE